MQMKLDVRHSPPWHRGIDNPLVRSSSSSGSSQGGTSNQDRPERFQTSPVTANNLSSLETTNRARRDRSVTQIQQTNSFALLEAKDDEEDDRNDEADLFDSDEETTRIFLQQPQAGAGATVRTMQPTFPPAPEFRPPTMVADPATPTPTAVWRANTAGAMRTFAAPFRSPHFAAPPE